ncbi:MAG: FtsX-like permease family protein [Clostridia bacterium]|jgi:putative ABC transport system permease protein|nr:FtsX-like permease family protein [Clostridia bacterium]
MKILNDLSIKDLKLNKKRSAVIIIGIILSTALICGVAGIVTSFQHTLIEMVKEREGNFHAKFYEVPKDELKYIQENRNVKDYYLSEELGYSYLEGSKNKYKPYLNVIAMDEKYLKNMGLQLSEGRMPENESELVISKHIISNGKVNYKIGDTISLEIGTRQLTTGEKLNQNNPYLSEENNDQTIQISEDGLNITQENEKKEVLEEEIVNTTKKEYKIVGIIERPWLEDYSAPGYTVITKLDKIQNNANIAVLYTNLFKYQEYTEQINEMIKAQTREEKEEGTNFRGLRKSVYISYKYNFELNYDLLSYEGANLSDNTLQFLYTIGGVIMAIVLVSSVFVIRNGFAISITERLKQYGMLSSVGATKKQIKKSVYFEGIILGCIGIPLGILSGILAIDILLRIVSYIFNKYIEVFDLVYSISWEAILLSVIIAVITIWLSCKSSARKASKVTPIEAIRSADDVKLKAKKVKCPKIITKIFKIGGEIAYKNLKRSKKKYRTTVISIIVSVVTFIAISSFIEFGFKTSESYYTEIGYNIALFERTDEINTKENLQKKYERFSEVSKLKGIDDFSIKRMNSLEIEGKEHFTEFANKIKAKVYDANGNEVEGNDTVTIMALGKQQYNKFIEKIGGKYEDYKDGAILLDNCINYDEEGNKVRGNLYKWQKGDIITGKITIPPETEDESNNIRLKDLSIKIIERTSERPMGFENMYSDTGYLIVSDEYIEKIGYASLHVLQIDSKDCFKVEDEIKQFYKSINMNEDGISILNYEESVKQNNAIVLVISIFLYGFITVITLIGITNIFNTITTNMNLRKKEFAMLKSIGMTKKEFNRMIRLESIFYGLKSLIIGIPIGVGLSYLIYKAFEIDMGMNYVLPVKSIMISIIFVAVVIGIIMKYSMSRINKQNIIETIRNDNI